MESMEGQGVEIRIRGIVQGVGFRPFVYRLATGLGLKGEVSNDEKGVVVRLRAKGSTIETFSRLLASRCPPLARIDSVEIRPATLENFRDFRIVKSSKGGKVATEISPDIATCKDCLNEILDPADRRHGYAFTNCTNCGPRYTIIKALPYDRPLTSMKPFVMCKRCQQEYEDPLDRRFHAQPNACPKCGPRPFFMDLSGEKDIDRPLERAVELIKRDGIVAIKGLGGFHLACSAFSDVAISVLRKRKRRPFKPLAIMVRDIKTAKRLVVIDENSKGLLTSFTAPIVLLKRKEKSGVSRLIAPGIGDIGIMLPYTPLHHLLLRIEGCPEALVMTSGNPKDEPLCTSNDEAFSRLSGFVDGFLMHNRDIFTGVDDSVLRTFSQGPYFIRRSRGYAPAPLPFPVKATGILAAGAELKNTFCLIKEGRAYLSQHIGNLVTRATLDFYRKNISHLSGLLEVEPRVVACDIHSDYMSTRYALETALPVIRVQHHFAHAASVMAEHHLKGPVVAICLDGTGLGTDRTIWGGEVLICTKTGFERRGRLRPFRLPGGDACAKSPWRAALSTLLKAHGGDAPFPEHLKAHKGEATLEFVRQMVIRKINSPLSSSLGRLFDAAAALTGLCLKNSYEAQAAMELEALCEDILGDTFINRTDAFDHFLNDERLIREKEGLLELNWAPLWQNMLHDAAKRPGDFSLFFHCMVVAGFSSISEDICKKEGIDQVVLSGGCMQNRVLVQGFLDYFEKRGIQCYINRKVPSNDGGISLGQAFVAANIMQKD